VSDGAVHFEKRGSVALVVIDRPDARNAMTMAMYDQLAVACGAVASDPEVRVATFRGAGNAFAAGTDIHEFLSFSSAEDGIIYEQRIDAAVTLIEKLPVPTIAVVEGVAMGGGLLIAAACDFRVATPVARFGVPIARTLGNCLSMANTARLVAALGVGLSKRLLLLGDAISAEEALRCGFVLELASPDSIDEAVRTLCTRLASNAPITMRVAKESIRRLVETLPAGDDLIRSVYASDDFRTGVRAFLAKQPPNWTGR
jgi:enoyl-CoA hydratase/carnithine racemase